MTSTLPMPRDRIQGLILAAVVLVGLALRLHQFRGFGAVDDAGYAQLAHQMATGTFQVGTYGGPAVFPLRVGIILPTALLFRLFGVSEWSLVALPLSLSVLSIPLAYVITHQFFGPRAALFGAGLWALLPLDTFHATILVPDLAAAFFASLALAGLFFLLAESRRGTPRAFLAGGVVIGTAFGVSWLCKESVVYLVPFCGVLIASAVKRDPRRLLPLWAGVAIGSLAVLGAELMAYYSTTGDWLFRLHETERNYRQYENAFLVGGADPHALLRRLFLTGPSTMLRSGQFLYLPLLAAVVCARALYARDRSYLLPTLWLGTLALMFNFSSSSLSSYVPLTLFERYLYPLLWPAVVIVAGFLAHLVFDSPAEPGRAKRREAPFWATLLIVGLVLVSGYKSYANQRWYPEWAAEVRALRTVLRPSDRVHADILSIHGLEFFWSYPDSMNTVDFEDAEQAGGMQAGDYVLLNTTYLEWLVRRGGWWPTRGREYRLPAFHENVPPTWETVWNNGNAALYRVR